LSFCGFETERVRIVSYSWPFNFVQGMAGAGIAVR
jgi:hypothetical protein